MAIEKDDDLNLDSLEDLEAEALKRLKNSDDADDNLEDDNEENDKNDDSDSKDDNDDKSDDNNDDADDDNDAKSEDDKKVDFKPVEFEIAGQKIVLNSEEELRAMLSKGAESLSKQDDNLSLEKAIIEQGKITADDLKLLIDAKMETQKQLQNLQQIAILTF